MCCICIREQLPKLLGRLGDVIGPCLAECCDEEPLVDAHELGYKSWCKHNSGERDNRQLEIRKNSRYSGYSIMIAKE